jgi:hypothetical protein
MAYHLGSVKQLRTWMGEPPGKPQSSNRQIAFCAFPARVTEINACFLHEFFSGEACGSRCLPLQH